MKLPGSCENGNQSPSSLTSGKICEYQSVYLLLKISFSLQLILMITVVLHRSILNVNIMVYRIDSFFIFGSFQVFTWRPTILTNFFVIFLSFWKQILEQNLELDHDSFLLYSSQFNIH
jgi:hypothetical protein